MRKIIYLILVFPVLICCNKNDDGSENPIDQLPPATQTGANTAGCLVNGVAFLPKGFIAGGNLSMFYVNGLDFNLSIGEKKDGILKNLNVTSLNESLEVGKVYYLGAFEENSKYGLYSVDVFTPPSPNFYQTTISITGELTITHHDFDKAILSGVFWFDAINSEGNIVEVRNGRFDGKY